MITSLPRALGRHSTAPAAILFVILLLPPVRHLLQAHMYLQMLVQIPLLFIVGWYLRDAIPSRVATTLGAWNRQGIPGVLLATFATAYWMLPRSLDAAVNDPVFEAIKFASVPLLIGLPFALSWPRMGFVVRGVFFSEFVAMFFRIGWLYMASKERLCSEYLLSDQQRTGQIMMVIGAAILLWLIGKVMWGHFDPSSDLMNPDD